MNIKTNTIIAAAIAALAVLMAAAFGIATQTDPKASTTTAQATTNQDDSEETARILARANTITLTGHNMRGIWSWTIEADGKKVAATTGELRANGVQYTMTTTNGNTISSTTGTATSATSAHIYDWNNQETGTITGELAPATTLHAHLNENTNTSPTIDTITVTSGLPTKATINNANGEQACELSQEYVNTPVWESVYTLTCTNNATTTPDTGLNGITAVWLSIHTINATR